MSLLENRSRQIALGLAQLTKDEMLDVKWSAGRDEGGMPLDGDLKRKCVENNLCYKSTGRLRADVWKQLTNRPTNSIPTIIAGLLILLILPATIFAQLVIPHNKQLVRPWYCVCHPSRASILQYEKLVVRQQKVQLDLMLREAKRLEMVEMVRRQQLVKLPIPAVKTQVPALPIPLPVSASPILNPMIMLPIEPPVDVTAGNAIPSRR